jgi:ATP-dependent DNA ligase
VTAIGLGRGAEWAGARRDRGRLTSRTTTPGARHGTRVVKRGYEGLVAKDDASVYAGGPSRDWLKVKQTAWTDPEDLWKRLRF